MAASTTSPFHPFSHGHKDLVLALSFNQAGTRACTASSDHRLKIWDRDQNHDDLTTNTWTVIDVWRAHSAEITDVQWAGPYAGQIVASIGEDGWLRVWKEDVRLGGVLSGKRFVKIWEQVTTTGSPFTGLDFKSSGSSGGGETFLAFVTRDGLLSVCEPEDYDDLSAWTLLWSEFLVPVRSRAEETSFRVSWHDEVFPPWPAVLAGLDRKTLSLAVAVGERVKIYRTDRDRRFYVAAVLDGATDLVRDVSWANGSVRGFDVVATASKDGLVRVYEIHTPAVSSGHSRAPSIQSANYPKILPANRPARSSISAGLAGGGTRWSIRDGNDERGSATDAHLIKHDVRLAAEFATEDGGPWRLSWSQLGDVLMVTGDDGTTRLWKKAVDGRWVEAIEVDALDEDT